MIYRAEFEDDEIEVFDCDDDIEAMEEAEDLEADHGELYSLSEVDSDYEDVRDVYNYDEE